MAKKSKIVANERSKQTVARYAEQRAHPRRPFAPRRHRENANWPFAPIMAHPPMPPKKPVMTLAGARVHASRVLLEWVSVTSSTSLAVSSDLRMPTSAIATASGPMICSVSVVKCTSGDEKRGQ